MPRPQNNRIINEPPIFNDFKPVGIRSYKLEKIELSLDEYEAIRLADHLNLNHEDAAKRMEISRPTFTRLIEKARQHLADFLINGKRLNVTGGKVHFKNNVIQCTDCKHIIKTKIKEVVTECPECKSTNLHNWADNFGHGECCVNEEEQHQKH